MLKQMWFQLIVHFIEVLVSIRVRERRGENRHLSGGVAVEETVGNLRVPAVQVDVGPGAHPTYCSMHTRGSFPWVKRPRREADHSPPSNAEVKKEWSCSPLPPYAFCRLQGATFRVRIGRLIGNSTG
jgi:hypothetical protein